MAVPETLHVMKDGIHFLDTATGNIYRREPESPSTSGTVATPTPVLNVKLSESAKRYVASAKAALAQEAVEHFVSLGIDKHGNICAENQQTQQESNHAHVEIKPIMQAFTEGQAVGGIFLHNHPTGEREMSPEDKALTQSLRNTLRAYSMHGIFEHEVVPGAVEPEHIEEAEQEADAWVPDEYALYRMREAEESRLWKAYGGRNPYAR
jgi:hypothetical protein